MQTVRHTAFIILASLCSPALLAGGLGVLKPGARIAPQATPGNNTHISVPESSLRAPGRPDFYGVVLSADDAPGAAPSIQSFRAGYSPVPEMVMELDYMSGCSGTSIGGDFYYMEYAVNSSGSITSVDWTRVDMEAKRVTKSVAQEYAIGVCMDMTYDPTTSTVYGISAVSDVLVKIDAATGEATPVAQTLPFYTLSADAAGQLYGIALDSQTREGVLYTVNKMTGGYMKVGSTGVKMLTDESGSVAYFQTASFSRANGSLYWAVANAEGASALYRVDVATGRASYLAPFPDNEMFVALFDMEQVASSGVPGAVSGVSATADPSGALKVDLKFTAPVLTAGGDELKSLTGLKVFRGAAEESVYSVPSPQPGKEYSWTDNSAVAGFNAYRIVSANDEGEALPVYVSTFCGEDYPSAPTEVTVAVDASGYPAVSWKAPVTGLNGLTLDSSRLTYTVLRDINGRQERVGEGIEGTTFTDHTLDISTQSYPYYYVIASSSAGEGRQSQAAGCYAGPAYKLPLVETFRDCMLSTSPWIMQSIDLGGTWELNYISTFPGSGPYNDGGMLVFIGFRSVEGAQARIATPLLDFENVANPELRFHFYYLDMSDDDLRFDDHMVVEASVDGGEFQPVANGTYYQHDADTRWTECVLPLREYAGKKNVAIGFHGYSGGGFDLLLDNIRVLDGEPGAIDSVDADSSESEPVYYTPYGVRVDASSLVPGIYIRVTSRGAQKIAIP